MRAISTLARSPDADEDAAAFCNRSRVDWPGRARSEALVHTTAVGSYGAVVGRDPGRNASLAQVKCEAFQS